MLKFFRKLLGSADKPSADSPPKPMVPSMDGPYGDDTTNFIYQLLFCDRPALFAKDQATEEAGPWKVLFDEPGDLPGLRRIASDPTMESRVRALAYNRLRKEGCQVEPKHLLGTIVEVALPYGLDTLAVFTDGTARYINHSGKMAVVEGSPIFGKEIEAVIGASQPIVQAIGPWDKARLPAPSNDTIRMTFLVSDGLYFGQGPMSVMQNEAMAAPLIQAATALLMKLTDETVR